MGICIAIGRVETPINLMSTKELLREFERSMLPTANATITRKSWNKVKIFSASIKSWQDHRYLPGLNNSVCTSHAT